MTSSLGADRSPRTRAGLSVVLAATLTALTALGPNAHAAEPADSPPDVQSLFGVTDSRHVEGAALAAGTLRDGRGSPSANAPVVLFAWPTEAVLTAAQDGDVLPLTPVAATATDRSGAFQLRVANTNVLERFLAGDGSADLAILIPNGSTHTVHPFSVSSDELRIAGAAARREAAQGRRDTSAGVEHGLGLHLGKPQAGEPAGEAVVDWDDYREMMVCYSTQKQNYGPVWTAVGETYNASGVRSDFRYQTNGSTSLGVAISASGYWATWKQENTVSRSTSSEINFPATAPYARRQWATQFEYRKYQVLCAGDQNTSHWEVRPTAVVGGVDYIVPTQPTAKYCSTYLAGSNFVKTATSAVTWSNGVNLSKHIGIDVSSRSGFSSTVRLVYYFDAKRRLCGTHDYPPGNAKRITTEYTY